MLTLTPVLEVEICVIITFDVVAASPLYCSRSFERIDVVDEDPALIE